MTTTRTVIAACFVALVVAPALAQTGGIAVRVLDPPADADWNPADIHHSVIYWNLADNLVFSGAAGPSLVDPRNVAAHTLARFAELGLRPVVAFELEFYLVDPERLELTEDGMGITVQPQVFSLLVFLIANRDLAMRRHNG